MSFFYKSAIIFILLLLLLSGVFAPVGIEVDNTGIIEKEQPIIPASINLQGRMVFSTITDIEFIQNVSNSLGTYIYVNPLDEHSFEGILASWLNKGCKSNVQSGYFIFLKEDFIKLDKIDRLFAFFTNYTILNNNDSAIVVDLEQQKDVLLLYCELNNVQVNDTIFAFVDNLYFDRASLLGSVQLGNIVWFPSSYFHELKIGTKNFWSFNNSDLQVVNNYLNSITNEVILVQKEKKGGNEIVNGLFYSCNRQNYNFLSFENMCD